MDQMIEQQEKLSKLLGVIVLLHEESEVEEAIKTLKGMSAIQEEEWRTVTNLF